MSSTPDTSPQSAPPEGPATPQHILEAMADEKLCAIGPAICERFGFVVDQAESRVIEHPARCIVRYPYTVAEDVNTDGFPLSGKLVINITYGTGVPEVKIVSTEGETAIDFREVAARYAEILGRQYSRSIFRISGMPDNAALGALWSAEIEEAQK